MEAYKEINKALITHNQDLRMQNSILQKEIILLRHQIMDEHAKRVICEKKFKRILIDNFRTAMAKIDPENGLLELLGNDDDDDESAVGLRKVRARSLRKPQSSEILKELRRSISLQPRSSIVASPTRRSSSDMSIETEYNKSRNRSMTAIECSFDSVERSPGDNSIESIASVNNSDGENVTQEDDDEEDGNGTDDNSEEIQQEDEVVENVATPRNMQNLSFIWEEEQLQGEEASLGDDHDEHGGDVDDEDGGDDDYLPEKDEENNIQDEVGENNIQDEVGENNIQEDEVEELQNKDNLQKRDEPTINTSKQHSRNKQKLEQSPTLVQPIKKSRRNASTLLRSPLKDISNLANDDVKQKSHTKPRNLQAVRRGKRRSIVSDETTIQTVRNMANQQTEKQDEPFSIANNATKDRDPSLESAVVSIGFSEELTIGQFAEALSSTPNNFTTLNTNTREEDTKYSEQSTRTCAKRSCRPKCLTEPNLVRKLRNEATNKSKRTSRKKK